MKWMIASDLHGSKYYCEQLFAAYEKEQPDRVVLLGDLLYHGPRNALPKDYDTKAVMELLNAHRDVLVCVRGNCDAEVDQMVLEFPMMADYAVLDFDGIRVYATHGHMQNEENPPRLQKGDILLCGHTHVPSLREHDSFVYMNPGSVSIPKENSHHGYMIYEKGTFLWKDLQGTIVSRVEWKGDKR